jgi:hypothetical protein
MSLKVRIHPRIQRNELCVIIFYEYSLSLSAAYVSWKGLKGTSKMKKSELVQLIKEHIIKNSGKQSNENK